MRRGRPAPEQPGSEALSGNGPSGDTLRGDAVSGDDLPGDLRDEIRALEERLLDPAVRADRAAVAALLDPEFTEIGQSGRLWDRASTLDALAAESGSGPGIRAGSGPGNARGNGEGSGEPLRVSGFALRALAPGVVLATYTLEATNTRRSSIWRRGEGEAGGEAGWHLVFHQGTRVVKHGR